MATMILKTTATLTLTNFTALTKLTIVFRWRKAVETGKCEEIHDQGHWLTPTVTKHVPGSHFCQSTFLKIEYVSVTATPPSPIQSANCVLFTGGGFNCRDWKSATLLEDLDQATKIQNSEIKQEPLDPKLLSSRSSLTIWTATLRRSTEMDLLSFWTVLPCVSKFTVAVDLFLKDNPTGCDECLLLHCINALRTCGTRIPLTRFRLSLLGETVNYLKKAMVSAKAKLVLEKCFAGFKSKIALIDAESERAKVSISLSLLLSTLRSLDNDWQQASEQNEAFFTSLDTILSNIQQSTKKTVILTADIAANAERSLSYIKSVKSLDSTTVITVLNQLIN